MKQAIKEIVLQAIDEKFFPGCVIGIIKQGKRIVLPFGKYSYEDDARPMQADSIFDIASITKSIPTSSLALLLIDRGKMRLDDKLISFVPEFQNPDREQVVIWHLLTHTLDFDLTLSLEKDKKPDAILQRIFTARFKSKPGTKYAYVNATSILLGFVVERISKMPLDVLAKQEFFDPFDMQQTSFRPKHPEDVVPTEIDPWRGRLIQGEVHDESAYALSKKYTVGSAGLFSTVPDLLSFLEMLLHRGVYKGKKYFSSRMIEKMYTNQLETLGQSAGLGWELNQPRFMGKHSNKQAFGKTGFTGCSVVCDPIKEVAYAILSNYTYPKRKPEKTQRDSTFGAIVDIVFCK